MEGVLALMAGILSCRFWGFTPFAVLALTAGSLVLMLLSRLRPATRAVIPLLAAAGMAALLQAEQAMTREDGMAARIPARGTVIGQVVAPFDHFGQGYRFCIKVDDFNGTAASGVVQVSVREGKSPPLPGDKVRTSMLWIKPVVGMRNIGAFDYGRYMADAGIAGRASLKNDGGITFLADGNFLNPWRIGEKARRGMSAFITGNFNPKIAAQVSAMTIGITGGLRNEERRAYSASGLAHLFSVSGLHVGLVGGAAYFAGYAFFFWLFWVFWRPGAEGGLHRKWAALAACGTVFLFVYTAGASVSAERAGIMAAVYFASIILGRENDLLNALAMAAGITLVADPAALFSPSFIMSYSALVAIALHLSREKARRETMPDSLETKNAATLLRDRALDTLKLSAAITAVMAPVMMSIFNEVHAAGILANVAAIPLAGLAVPLVFPAAALGSLYPPLGAAAALVAGAGFWCIDRVALFFSSFPALSFSGPPPPCWLIAAWYVVFFVWALRNRFFAGGLAGIAALTIFFYLPGGAPDRNEVRFIDVGQGDATLLLFAGGHAVLVDAGARHGNFDAGEMAVLPELRRLNIRRLDAVIATHGDMDHVGGLGAVIKRFNVARFYDNGGNEPALAELREMARARGIPAQTLGAGDGINFGDGGISILHPSGEFLERRGKRSANDRSLMLAVTMNGARILLTADIGVAAERHLIGDGAVLNADVLKLGHHGSRGSTSPEFLAAVKPRIAIISVGRYNRYHLPARATLERIGGGISLFRTDTEGEIVLHPERDAVTVQSYAYPKPFKIRLDY